VVVGDLVQEQVVHEGPVLVQEGGVVDLPVGQLDHGIGGEPVQKGHGLGPLDADLAHVAHVEQADLGAHGHVLGDDAGGVLDGHVPAAEVHHLGPEGPVDGVEGGLQEFGHGFSISWAS